MKLTTDINPRKDGTVTVKAAERAYTFADEGGMLVAEVHEDDVGYLLETGNFYPADEADIEAGIAAVTGQQDGDEDGEGEDDIDDAPEQAGAEATQESAKAGKKKAK